MRLFIFTWVIISSLVFAQSNEIKTIADYDSNCMNPVAFLSNPGTITNNDSVQYDLIFELKDSVRSNIATLKYFSDEDKWGNLTYISDDSSSNINPAGALNIGSENNDYIFWQTNKNGNWDIVFVKNDGAGWSEIDYAVSSEADEINPKLAKIYSIFGWGIDTISTLLTYEKNNSIVVQYISENQKREEILFEGSSEVTYKNADVYFDCDLDFSFTIYALAVKNEGNSSTLVLKKRTELTNWSDEIIIFEGNKLDNPSFYDRSEIVTFEENSDSGKSIYYLDKIDDLGSVAPSQFNNSFSGSLSQFFNYNVDIITKNQNNLIWGPHGFKLQTNDSAYIVMTSDTILFTQNYFEIPVNMPDFRMSLVFTPYTFGMPFVIWEDEVDGKTILLGYQRSDIQTGVNEELDPSKNFFLNQNYPNPFNPTTKIGLVIPSGVEGLSTLKIYDLLGREINTLLNKQMPAGTHEVEFDATGLPSGVYFYQLKTGSFMETKKMILLR